MKHCRKITFLVLTLVSLGFLLQSCASSRNSCCNDLSRNYKPPKSHKRNVY